MSERARLRVWEKAAFGVGSIGNGIVNTAIASLLLLFYNQAVGLNPAWVGAALMISIICDALWDPIIGHWTDNTRTRWGRRHPFMYLAALPTALAFYMLFSPPLDWSDEAQFFYLLVSVMAVRFFISVFEISASALVPELVPDYDERTGMWSIRYFFGLAGALLMITLAYSVFLPAGGGLTSAEGYVVFGLVCAIIICVTLLISALSVHRWIPRLRPPAVERWTVKEAWHDLASVLRNRTFLVIMLSGLISGLATGLTTSLSIYFNTYFWELKPEHISALVSAGLLAGIFGVTLAPLVSKRLGKKQAMIMVFWGYLFVAVIPISLRLLGVLPPNGDPLVFWVVLIDAVVAGALALMGIVIVVSMLTDIVEDNAAATGRRTEGLLFAFNGVLQKSTSGIGTFSAGLLLAFVQFPEVAVPGQVEESVLRSLALIYLPITFTLTAGAIVALSFLRVGRDRHEANLRKIENDPVIAGSTIALPSPTGVDIRPETRDVRI
jgi:glycoside/pentoside/hexuronide:cation symporter, GPH family